MEERERRGQDGGREARVKGALECRLYVGVNPSDETQARSESKRKLRHWQTHNLEDRQTEHGIGLSK